MGLAMVQEEKKKQYIHTYIIHTEQYILMTELFEKLTILVHSNVLSSDKRQKWPLRQHSQT